MQMLHCCGATETKCLTVTPVPFDGYTFLMVHFDFLFMEISLRERKNSFPEFSQFEKKVIQKGKCHLLD